MRWMRFRIRTNEASEDIIISTLADIGLCGAQIEDKAPLSSADRERMFSDDTAQDDVDDDGTASLSFFAEINDDGMLCIDNYEHENQNETNAMDNSYSLENGTGKESSTDLKYITPEEETKLIQEQLELLRRYADIGDGSISVDITEDKDWINNWKQYFHKFFIDDILVIPSWEQPDEADIRKAGYYLHIDPGTAFGTGMHDTTQLCIRQLRKYVQDTTQILDIGTGSGVLSILALMFGAAHAVGTDLDPCSIPAVKENLRANSINEDRFDLVIGNVVDDALIQQRAGLGKYDIVVANILPVVLVPLAAVAISLCKPGGIYITSGIVEDKMETVKAANIAAGFEIIGQEHQGGWVSITSRRKP